MKREMIKNYKVYLSFFFLILLLVILYFNVDREYYIDYEIDKIKVKEEFKEDAYYLEFKYKDIIYNNIIISEYNGHNVVNNIKVLNKDTENCLLVSSKISDDILYCSSDKEVVNTTMIDNIDLTKYLVDYKEDAYSGIDLFNTSLVNLYVWNYNGFVNINEDSYTVDLLDKDIYDDLLIFNNDDYIILPKYDDEFVFDSFIYINIKNNKVNEFSFDIDISLDSYFVGENKDGIYLVDNKNQEMYCINIKKHKVELVVERYIDFKDNGIVNKKSVKEIIDNEMIFYDKEYFKYELKDNKLKLNINDSNIDINISKNVDRIVSIKDDIVLYLEDNSLMFYSPIKGGYKIASNSEWKFNDSIKFIMVNN